MGSIHCPTSAETPAQTLSMGPEQHSPEPQCSSAFSRLVGAGGGTGDRDGSRALRSPPPGVEARVPAAGVCGVAVGPVELPVRPAELPGKGHTLKGPMGETPLEWDEN